MQIASLKKLNEFIILQFIVIDFCMRAFVYFNSVILYSDFLFFAVTVCNDALVALLSPVNRLTHILALCVYLLLYDLVGGDGFPG